MALEIFSFGGLEIFSNKITVDVTFTDDDSLEFGSNSDIALLNRSTILAADTALTGVLIGTPESQAIAANSFMLSNTTASGDLAFYVNKGGNSQMVFWADGSAGDVALLAADGGSIDLYVDGSKEYEFTNTALIFTNDQELRLKANSATALEITDGTTTLMLFDTRSTVTGVTSSLFTQPAAQTLVSATGSTYSLLGTADFSLTLVGGTNVTAIQGGSMYVGQPTYTSASATTVTTASSLYVKGDPVAAGSVTITNNYALYNGGASYLGGAVATGGMVYIGDTANANMTLGLTANQGANDNQIVALKSSDVATVLTTAPLGSDNETDDFLTIEKWAATTGGARIKVLGENAAVTTNLAFESYGGQADTTKSTAGRALIEFYASQHDGANALSAVGADGNIFGIRGTTINTVLLVDEDGDLWLNGGIYTDGVAVANNVHHWIGGTFTSGGVTTWSQHTRVAGALTGANGDTIAVSFVGIGGSVTTQNNSETIGVVSHVDIGNFEPTKGNDTITIAANLHLGTAPTVGSINAAIYADTGDILLEAGSLYLKELSAARTDIAAWGQFWVKDDAPNTPYFTDDAGTDKQLAVFDVDNGEMIVTSNQTATIETADTPHAFTGFSTGTVNDFTFNAGITGAITAYADYSGTVAGTVKATSGTHGLTTGDIITIRGTTNYNGVFQVTVIDGNEFYFTDTWVADDGASDFEMGDYLLAGTGTAGEYDLSWNSSLVETGGAGSVVLFKVYLNTTDQTKAGSGRKFANNDRGSVSGGAHLTLAVDDRIWFAHQSSGTNDLTVSLMDLRIMRLA
jgi:hypothetical protein